MSAWSVRRAKRRERVSRRIKDEEKLGNTEIGRLRHRFIRIAMIAISVILLFILIIINGTMGVIININLNRSLIRIAGEQPDGYYTQADEGALQSLGAQLMPNVRITSVDYYVLTVDTNGTVLSTDAHTMSELTAVQEADMVSLTVLHNPTLEPGRTVKFSYAGESYAARVVDKEAQTQAKAEASAGASASDSSSSASASSSEPSSASTSEPAAGSLSSSASASAAPSASSSSAASSPSASSSSQASSAASSSSASSSPSSSSTRSSRSSDSESASPAPSPTSSAYNAGSDDDVSVQDGTIDIVFLNYTEVHNWQRQLLDMSVIIAFLSVFVFWLVVVSLSRRAVEPSIKTLQTQKRFITNASHELKTPVSIISADAEVLEAVNGENEWTRSIINQSKRLNDLISALVSLTKAGENEKFHLADVDMTQLATKAAQDFAPVIQQAGKTLQTHIQDDVHAQAELRSITEVLNILLDNSAKYCDDGGMVDITLAPRQGIRGGVALTVSNDYKDGAGQDYSRFFERFYRADESHNSGKQGFGIGLAMAQELVTRMNGTVDASWHDGRISFTVNLR
ncbi:sensor histidine kinase [Pseudoscardovia suis]|uniref:sensor histidine kinase n=1 Tax=Pseudoscardovia suis TaxID=987063 RepID=UPI003F98C96E